MNRIKVAVVGCGKQAPKHIRGLRSVPDVEVVVADINRRAAETIAAREQVTALPHVDAIFDDDSIQALSICTPTRSHASLIEKAVLAGKHFLCEKPLCENQEDMDLIRSVMKERECIGMVGYIYRFAPVFEEAKNLLSGVPELGESSVLGRIVASSFRLGGRGSHRVWKHCKATGGGAINEMLVHMVDLAIWYFGAVCVVSVLDCGIRLPKRMIQGEMVDVDAEDFVLVKLQHESGVVSYCQADLVTPAFTQMVEVQGDHGTFMGSIQPNMPSFVYVKSDTSIYKAGRNALNFGVRDLYSAQMAEFIRAVRTGTQPDRCTIQDSVLLQETMEKIRAEVQSCGKSV